MPNTFAPRAYSNVIRGRVDRLRVQYDGPPGDVKEWHAMVDVMDGESTQAFLDEYGDVESLPYVISGVGREDGYVPESEG